MKPEKKELSRATGLNPELPNIIVPQHVGYTIIFLCILTCARFSNAVLYVNIFVLHFSNNIFHKASEVKVSKGEDTEPFNPSSDGKEVETSTLEHIWWKNVNGKNFHQIISILNCETKEDAKIVTIPFLFSFTS
jgi:hypothetical protein